MALLAGLCAAAFGAGFAGQAGATQPRPAATAVAMAADNPAPTSTTAAIQSPHIIPRPNSGRAPSDPGERGGWMQEALFFAMCAAIVLMAGLVWRDSRKKRRAQGRLAPRST